MTLAILICTLPERSAKLRRLTSSLDRQISKYNGLVFYKIHDAGRSISTGRKRNMLIEQSDSDYFSFIDDDDNIAENYLDYVMAGMTQNPDVITFNGWMTTNGTNRQNFTIRLGSAYEERNKHFYRFPNHLCVFKREKVRQFKFPDLWVQEDYRWAKAIHDSKVLKTEVYLNHDLYHYDFTTNKPSYASTRIRQ